MLKHLILKSGLVGYPLLIISILLFGYIFGQIIAWLWAKLRHRDFFAEPYCHTRLIGPLGGIAVSLGLLGSVTGFIRAFSAFNGKLDPTILTLGLSEAYYSTAFGLTLSIIALVSSYVFNLAFPYSKEGSHEENRGLAASDRYDLLDNGDSIAPDDTDEDS